MNCKLIPIISGIFVKFTLQNYGGKNYCTTLICGYFRSEMKNIHRGGYGRNRKLITFAALKNINLKQDIR